AQVGDVNEPIAEWGASNECAEAYSFHNRAQETHAYLWQLRIRHGIDLFDSSISCFTGSRRDINGTVVLNGDVRSGFLGDGVDGFALRSNQLANLRYCDLDRRNLWSLGRHSIWAVNTF